MKVSSLLGTLAVSFAAMVAANALTILPARAIVTAGLAMTPDRCRQVSQREQLACGHGRLVKGPGKVYHVHMTLALKKVPYTKAPAPKPRLAQTSR